MKQKVLGSLRRADTKDSIVDSLRTKHDVAQQHPIVRRDRRC